MTNAIEHPHKTTSVLPLVEAMLNAPVDSIAPCVTGGNNRVFRVTSGKKSYLAKWYFGSAHDTRARLENEWLFLEYATSIHLPNVPYPVAKDAVANMAIYSFLEGHRPDLITEDMVGQASQWIIKLNHQLDNPRARALHAASESCFSANAHIELLRNRLLRLKNYVNTHAAFAQMLAQMETLSLRYQEQLLRGYEALGLAPQDPLPDEERCLSPSDFGFHNTLVSANGHVQFIDFEYAGWDDPAKMICDFFLHPGVPVNARWAPIFIEQLKPMRVDFDRMIARARLLYPWLGLRWCCIVLNVFVPEWAARRQFADPTWNAAIAQDLQLEKAARLLTQLQNNIL